MTKEEKYVVKNFETQKYYCGEIYGWKEESYLSDYFDTHDDAERFINEQDGKFQIETIYII